MTQLEFGSESLDPRDLEGLAGRQAVVFWGSSAQFGRFRAAGTLVGVADLADDWDNSQPLDGLLVYRDLGLGEDGDEHVGRLFTVELSQLAGVVLLTDLTAEQLVAVVNGRRVIVSQPGVLRLVDGVA